MGDFARGRDCDRSQMVKYVRGERERDKDIRGWERMMTDRGF